MAPLIIRRQILLVFATFSVVTVSGRVSHLGPSEVVDGEPADEDSDGACMLQKSGFSKSAHITRKTESSSVLQTTSFEDPKLEHLSADFSKYIRAGGKNATYLPDGHVGPALNAGKCFDASAWGTRFEQQTKWTVTSQGEQDSVLASLFSENNVGTTNKQFVEFGFPDDVLATSFGNGHNLADMFGFSLALGMDGMHENATEKIHRHFVTADTVVGLFDKYKVPLEADYVSVDVDSCDLWLFLAVTSKYRPRVMSVEYNINYPLGDYTSMHCKDPTQYSWDQTHDNLYGASLSALELAGKRRGYSLVYVSAYMDAFFVRDDLLCEGSAPKMSQFASKTGMPFWNDAPSKLKSELLIDFHAWLTDNPNFK
eukprot:gnl/TRDRNA2_/TRDRNA2_183125_c0_seq1.p1 gnl/TRDRNA2_/TRDRNA2_183125_c0~~gnl/TRDRNA2_/TRDRNA2_183125_c0_seq1.p1  ORF type:complete len:369 (+),score=43.78 gnl/TRDRNA2_/TRDRNA2_183125_c0_seq1:55-1161(+)